MKLFVVDLGILNCKAGTVFTVETAPKGTLNECSSITRLTSPACIPFRRLAASTEAEHSEAEVAVSFDHCKIGRESKNRLAGKRLYWAPFIVY